MKKPSENQIDDSLMKELKTKKLKERKKYKQINLKKEKNKCVICSKEITGRDKTVRHYQVHSDQKKKENKKEAEKSVHNGLLQCSICLLDFVDKVELQDHEDHYHMEKKYMCAVCNKCFIGTKHYISHMKSHGSTAEPIKCQQCDFSTTFPLAFSNHMQTHPKVDDPSVCEICGECFIFKKDLSAHKRKLHTIIETKIFQCTLCFKEYTSKPAVQNHLNQFHMGGQRAKRVCPFCGKSISENKFNDHVRIHEGLRPHACTYCNKRFTARRYLTEHIRIHTGLKPYVCQYCGKAFSQKSPLTIHLRSHTGETPYVCPICTRGFTSKTSLDNHIKNDAHGSLNKKRKKYSHVEQYIRIIKIPTNNEIDIPKVERVKLPRNPNKQRKKQKDLNREKNKCVTCNQEIIGRKKTVQHYLTHAEQKKKKNKEEAEKAFHNGLLQCSTCLEDFVDKSALQIHEDHFHIQHKFMCAVCNKCFIGAQNFMHHIRIHEPNTEPMKCSECNFSTTLPSSYSNHLRSHLKQDGPAMCEICGACLKSRKELIAHLKNLHSTPETKIFQCTLCLKEYTSKPPLQHHINKLHMGQQRSTRICDICGKNISENKFKDHKRIHEGLRPFACTYCNKRFNARRYLTEHIRIHTGQRPYVCQYCGKSFTQKSPLKIHLRSHTGETPYVCLICSRGFVAKSLLDNHMKNEIH